MFFFVVTFSNVCIVTDVSEDPATYILIYIVCFEAEGISETWVTIHEFL